tara:strand:+ start:1259 stop:1519 length:261 start_codon:yes stop_codon:yes gene_type:complete
VKKVEKVQQETLAPHSRLDTVDLIVLDAQFIANLMSSIVTFTHRYTAKGMSNQHTQSRSFLLLRRLLGSKISIHVNPHYDNGKSIS